VLDKVAKTKEMLTEVSSPEKAGVGGSIPSLATIYFNHFPAIASTSWFHLVPKL
jgi:hypothetical protein